MEIKEKIDVINNHLKNQFSFGEKGYMYAILTATECVVELISLTEKQLCENKALIKECEDLRNQLNKYD